MKWLAVANPAAGRSHEAERLLAELEHDARVTAVVALTDGPGSGTRIARQARDFDGLIVIGGDGTISECLTGMDLPRQALAVIPAGHGNCLGRDLGLCRPADALAALQRPSWQSLDLMEVTIQDDLGAEISRTCASTLAAGYVTDVVQTGRRRLAALGRAAYAAAALITWPRRFRARHALAAQAPGGWAAVTGVVVNNTRHLANFRAFPEARLDDGELDVMLQGYGWPRQLLHNFAVLAGSSAFGPLATHRTTGIELEFESPRTVMADGELFADVTRLTVTCRAAAVQCATRWR